MVVASSLLRTKGGHSSAFNNIEEEQSHSLLSTPISSEYSYETRLRSDDLAMPKRPIPRLDRRFINKVQYVLLDLLSIVLSWPILLFFLIVAIVQTKLRSNGINDAHRPHDAEEHVMWNEDVTRDETYYARRWGYHSQLHHVVTDDGYILRLYRITKKGDTSQVAKKAVLLGHGLFQCSGAFVTNEEKSLAFVLVDQGYDVWVGNNRAVGCLDHLTLSYKDREYWNWGLKELGTQDFAAFLDYICLSTGQKKVAYIGHSQGNAIAFIGLTLRPELSNKLSCFIALAPAVFSGNLVNTFPLRTLIHLNDTVFWVVFGNGAFLSVMDTAQKICNPALFSSLAYSMFSYLFSWWDHHWLRRRKQKYFQFTPRLVSSRLLADWITGWGRQGVCVYVSDNLTRGLEERSFHKVPLAAFYGTDDHLVDGERFVRSFSEGPTSRVATTMEPGLYEPRQNNTLFPTLDLVHVERINGYEHMDTIWAHDNHITTYPGIFRTLSMLAKWD